MMKITVAVCTWNRASLLEKTLERMTHLQQPKHVDWELLVVNNNCTDTTDAVIAAFAEKLPIRRVLQPVPGLSNARNAAVENAAGDYIVWTDDDVLVDSQWLVAYAEAFARDPDACVFGGPVAPWFEGEAPRWLREGFDAVSSAFATRDLGAKRIPLDGQRNVPFGANFAVRVVEQRAVRYDPALGRQPGATVLGEEVAVIQQMLARGGHGWWIPQATVQHWIPKSRQSMQYLCDYYVGQGRTYMRAGDLRGRWHFLGRPAWLWRRTAWAMLQSRWHRIARPPRVWMRSFVTEKKLIGQFQEAPKVARTNGARPEQTLDSKA
jgi:glycosyltransferase involved in cell wall biosynthesis